LNESLAPGGREVSTIMGKINSKHIFIVYLIGLVNFVIVKFFGDVQRVIDRVASNKAQKAMGYWNVSVKPSTPSTSERSVRRYMQPNNRGVPCEQKRERNERRDLTKTDARYEVSIFIF
jgi:hypothetical protein